MTEEKNSVTTEIINQAKKKPVKKNVKTAKEVEIIVEEIKKENTENMLIVFEAGASYTTGSGITFYEKERIKEVPVGEAELLLRIDNFRLPNDAEKEMYYNNLEV